MDADLAKELILRIADGTAKEDTQFAKIYEAIQKKNEIPSRDISVALDYAGKAYEFVNNHWGEIFFVLMYLNKKGYFDKLKNKPKFKAFNTAWDSDEAMDFNDYGTILHRGFGNPSEELKAELREKYGFYEE